ncbi:MAG: LCP family protein, partial [Bifidobacteriaceae bacterium]|nr:LCP family protein [Bifidobacteriaceae bacterium]
IDVISIPRDTLVPLPACELPNGMVASAQRSAQINETFAKGSSYDPQAKDAGMACTVKAIEEITNIHLDAHILVDFAGFAAVVDALGGVEICLPDGFKGEKTNIIIDPGLHTLDGPTALQYARTRHGKYFSGERMDGSDLQRINRQQELVATVIHEVLASGNLQSLGKLNRTATAVTSSLYVSPNLGSVPALAGLAFALRNIKMENVSLFMAPVYTDSNDNNRVRLSQYSDRSRFGGLGANEIFELLATDRTIPGTVAYKVEHPEEEQSGGDGSTPGVDEPTDPSTPAETPDPGASDNAPAPDKEFVSPVTAPVTCEAAGQGSTG